MKKSITLWNLNDSSFQEIFEFVATHLLTQGEQALNEDEKCVYRSEIGKMCAVGCLIPEEDYKSRIENLNIIGVVFTLKIPQLPSDKLDMLVSLQSIHDNFMPPEWGAELVKLGESYNLNIDFINEFQTDTPSEE
jgi:hypothetical protein